MTEPKTVAFSPQELYVLGSAIKANYVMGLPSKDTYVFGELNWEEKAATSLREKGLLGENNKPDALALMCIRLLDMYQKSPYYLRLNDLLIGFIPNNNQDIIIMKANEEGQLQLVIEKKPVVLLHLCDTVPFYTREPHPEEKEFLTKEMPFKQAEALRDMELKGKSVLEIETIENKFTSPEEVKSQLIIYLEVEDRLIRMDPGANTIEYASIYNINREIFDRLLIKYRGDEENVGISSRRRRNFVLP